MRFIFCTFFIVFLSSQISLACIPAPSISDKERFELVEKADYIGFVEIKDAYYVSRGRNLGYVRYTVRKLINYKDHHDYKKEFYAYDYPQCVIPSSFSLKSQLRVLAFYQDSYGKKSFVHPYFYNKVTKKTEFPAQDISLDHKHYYNQKSLCEDIGGNWQYRKDNSTRLQDGFCVNDFENKSPTKLRDAGQFCKQSIECRGDCLNTISDQKKLEGLRAEYVLLKEEEAMNKKITSGYCAETPANSIEYSFNGCDLIYGHIEWQEFFDNALAGECSDYYIPISSCWTTVEGKQKCASQKELKK